ncbi:DUF6090 family protein [uncultured Psychroserpens sp.]|uniref:DUF6090 family protein n=1 Tax=uncultured Psychroserpens sp. TaxID=255436 RepID=UPI0026337B02|nr:DUF6090 family protein [uncultured Psychroserpens sp.]
MIKFFRRAKKKFISENKFSKYLLYAIGEIILVVIGILIALQINNKSEYRKERDQEIELLKSLANEIKLDILQIENNTKLSNDRLDNLETLLQSLASPNTIDRANFIEQSYQFVIDNYFQCNSGVFDEAVSSGTMSYVMNDTLRQQIFDYYRTSRSNYTDETSRKVTDDIITPLYMESLLLNQDGLSLVGINVETLSNLDTLDLFSIKENKTFWKMALMKFGVNREQINRWDMMKKSAVILKTQIDNELIQINTD